jgi:hypothetical protein
LRAITVCSGLAAAVALAAIVTCTTPASVASPVDSAVPVAAAPPAEFRARLEPERRESYKSIARPLGDRIPAVYFTRHRRR